MKHPKAPYIELGFYYGGLSDNQAMALFISQCLTLGARLHGKAYIHRGPNIANSPFIGPSNIAMKAIRIANIEDVLLVLADADSRLVRVEVVGLVGVAHEVEIVTYGPTLVSAKAHRHPIVLCISGDWACPVGKAMPLSTKAQKLGRLVCDRFLSLVEITKPDYGCITIEYSMESPSDLAADARSLAFQNCYVSDKVLGSSSGIKAVCRGAFVQEVAGGVYLSTDPIFNLRGVEISTEDALKISSHVAQIIRKRCLEEKSKGRKGNGDRHVYKR